MDSKYNSLHIDTQIQNWIFTSKTYPDCKITSRLPIIEIVNLKGIKKQYCFDEEFSSRKEISIPQIGSCEMIQSCQNFDTTIKGTAEIVLLAESPMMLIRVKVKNISDEPIRQNGIDPFTTRNIILGNKSIKNNFGCFVNGWQSWSYSGTYSQDQKPLISKLGYLQGPKLYDAATPTTHNAGIFTSDMFGAIINRTRRIGLVTGFLSQVNHFGHIHMEIVSDLKLKAHAAGDTAVIMPGSEIATDWLAVGFFELDQPDPIAVYLDMAAKVNRVVIPSEIPSGWCSWYHYFTNITSKDITSNLDHLVELKDELPIQFIQIDDGFERAVGDWLDTTPDFNGQMATLAEEISEYGFTPGLWLAPFIVHPKSILYQKHKDLMIHNAKNGLSNAGWNWDRFCTGLDMTQPDAQDYIQKVIQTAVKEWGYPYLKLDFLYAGALSGRYHDNTKTRAQILRKAMMDIRETAGETVYLLGCGAPLGSMLGIVDGMRIGTDVAPNWEPKHNGIELLFPNEPDIPSAKNSLQNTLTRAFLHKRWWHNDPDCLLIRESTTLTLAEVQTLASIIALTGGLLLISDDMEQVSRYRLRIAQTMLPLLPDRPWVIDWADQLTPAKVRQDIHNASGDYHLISFTNWSNKQIHKYLDLKNYLLPVDQKWIVRSYWDEKILIVEDGRINIDLPAHGTALFTLKLYKPGKPLYIGSDLHISQGMEVDRWEPTAEGVDLSLKLPRSIEGSIYIWLPRPAKALIGPDEIEVNRIDENIYQIRVSVKHKLDLQIQYK